MLASEDEMLLDDTPDHDEGALSPDDHRRAPPAPGSSVGLRPSETFYDGAAAHDPRPKPRAPAEPIGDASERSVGYPGSRRRSTGRFPAVQPPAPMATPPRPPRQAMGMGARATAPARALPIPRAPSVPPDAAPAHVQAGSQAHPAIDAFAGLDTLDGLSSLDELDSLGSAGLTPPGPPAEISPERGFGGLPQRELAREARRDTPPTLSVPASSKPVPSSSRRAPPSPAGLRFAKRTPVPMAAPVSLFDSAPRDARITSRPPDDLQDDLPPSEPAPSSLPDRAREMTILFEARNYSNALVLAESVLLSDPTHARAQRCAAACREMLTEKYLGSLGGRSNVPRVTMGAEEIRWLSLDHRAGFLLSFVDGEMSIDEVLDVSSMAELDALQIMYELREQGVIEIAEPNRRPQRR